MTRPTRPPRILHVLAAYDPKEAQGRSVQTIATRTDADHFLLCGRVLAGGGEFVDVVATGAGLRHFGWKDRDRLADAVRRVRPDVVHFHGGPVGAAAMASGWTGSVPVVATIYAWTTVGRHSFGHGVSIGHLRTTPVLAARTFANTVAPRVLLAASLRRAGVRVATTPDPAVRDLLAHHALPVGLFEGITPPQPAAVRRPVRGRLVFAGRAELTRGPDLLTDAVTRLRGAGLPVTARFCFLGTPDTDMVTATTTAEGCALHVGAVDLTAQFAQADAVVLPFRFDDTTLAPALVATEAMASGVPVIGGDVRCLRAAVSDGQTGLLVPPGDVGALARAIERLVTDPAEAARLGANARAEIDRRWETASVVDLAAWSYGLAAGVSTRAHATPFSTAPLHDQEIA